MSEARRAFRNVLRVDGQVGRAGGRGCRRLKELEDENAKLEKLLAEAMLDNAILKDVAAKKW